MRERHRVCPITNYLARIRRARFCLTTIRRARFCQTTICQARFRLTMICLTTTYLTTTCLVAIGLTVAPVIALSFGSFKLNWETQEEQFASCHGAVCDGDHGQWLLPILDTSEGIFCYEEDDRSLWPPGLCMACGQTIDAWLMNRLWDHTTPTGSWMHLFYWGNMDKVDSPVTGAAQHWLNDYRPDVCPDVHGAYVVGVDHPWRQYTPGIDFKLPKMSLDPVLQDVVAELVGAMGPEWEDLGRWARRMIAFSAVYDHYVGHGSPLGQATLDYWDRAYSLAWQWWIFATGTDGENTLMRDRPLMAMQAPLETGIPDRTSADVADLQDIIDETYGLFGETLTAITPATWGGIKARYHGDRDGRGPGR